MPAACDLRPCILGSGIRTISRDGGRRAHLVCEEETMLGFERRSAVKHAPQDEIERDETSDDIIGAVDAVLAFTVGRGLLPAAHVASLVEMLDAVPLGASCDAVVTPELHTIRDWAASGAVVSASELADRLLDLRLATAEAIVATPEPLPLVAV
jgi:hypothetical protein